MRALDRTGAVSQHVGIALPVPAIVNSLAATLPEKPNPPIWSSVSRPGSDHPLGRRGMAATYCQDAEDPIAAVGAFFQLYPRRG